MSVAHFASGAGVARRTTAQRTAMVPTRNSLIYDTDALDLYVGDGTTIGGQPAPGSGAPITGVIHSVGNLAESADGKKTFNGGVVLPYDPSQVGNDLRWLDSTGGMLMNMVSVAGNSLDIHAGANLAALHVFAGASSVLTVIPSGYVGTNIYSPQGGFHAVAPYAATPALIAEGVSGQAAHLFEARVNGVILSCMTNDGRLIVGGTIDQNMGLMATHPSNPNIGLYNTGQGVVHTWFAEVGVNTFLNNNPITHRAVSYTFSNVPQTTNWMRIDAGSHVIVGNQGVLGLSGAQLESHAQDNMTPIFAGYTSLGGQPAALVDAAGRFHVGYDPSNAFPSTANILGLPNIDNGAREILTVYDKSAMAMGVGGGIVFGGFYTADGGYATFADIQGVKADGIDGNWGGNLEFYTRNSPHGAIVKQLTIADSGSALFEGMVSSATEFRLQYPYSRVATADNGGGWGGGYNFDVNGGAPRYDSTGNISGVWFNGGGGIAFYASGSQPAHTAANPSMALTQTGDLSVSGAGHFGGDFIVHSLITNAGSGSASFTDININNGTSGLSDNEAHGITWTSGSGPYTTTARLEAVFANPGINVYLRNLYYSGSHSTILFGFLGTGQMIVGNSGAAGLSNAQMESHSRDSSTSIFAGYISTGGAAVIEITPQGWLSIGPGASAYGSFPVFVAGTANRNDVTTFNTDTGGIVRYGINDAFGYLFTGSNHPLSFGTNNNVNYLRIDTSSSVWVNRGTTGTAGAQFEVTSRDALIPIFAGYTHLAATAFQVDGDGNTTIGNGTGPASTQGLLLNYGANSMISAQGSANPSVIAYSTAGSITTKIQSISSISAGVVGTQSNHDLWIETNNTVRVVIDTAGHVTFESDVTCMTDLHMGRSDTSPAIIVDDVTKPLRIVTGAGVSFSVGTDGVFNAPSGFRTDGFAQLVNAAIGTTFHNAPAPTDGLCVEGISLVGQRLSGSAGAQFEVKSKDTSTPIFAGYTSTGFNATLIDPTGKVTIATTVPGGLTVHDTSGGASMLLLQGGAKTIGLRCQINDSDKFWIRNETDGINYVVIDTTGQVYVNGSSAGLAGAQFEVHAKDNVTPIFAGYTSAGGAAPIQILPDGTILCKPLTTNSPGIMFYANNYGLGVDSANLTIFSSLGFAFKNSSVTGSTVALLNGNGQMALGNGGLFGLANAQLESHAKDSMTPVFAGYTSTGVIKALIQDSMVQFSGFVRSDGADSQDVGGFIVDTGVTFNRIGIIKSPGQVGILMAGNATPLQLGHRTDSDDLTATWTGFPSTGMPMRIELTISTNGNVTLFGALVFGQMAEASIPNGGAAWSTDNPGHLMARKPDGTLKEIQLI